MKTIAAEVRPAVNLAEIRHRWDTIDGQEQRTMAEFRAAKARLLIEARGAFNARGDGFVEFVEKKLRMPFPTARDWMKAAGYVPPKAPGAGAKANHHDEIRHEPGTYKAKDSVEEEKKDDGIEADVEFENYHTAFLIRADQAVKFASYSGPITEETVQWARRVADAWEKLARQMEKKL